MGDKEPNIQITQSLCTSSALLLLCVTISAEEQPRGPVSKLLVSCLKTQQLMASAVENLTYSDLMENDMI